MNPSTPASQPAIGARGGHVRVGPMQPIAALLREHGVDVAALLAECGLAPDALDQADTQLPFHDGACLFERAARTLQRADFGLLVGARFDPASLGLLGNLMRKAPTVSAALYGLERFFHLQDRGSVLYFRQPEVGTAVIGYSIHDADVPGSDQVYDAVISMAQTLMRGLCGPDFRALEVHLAHAAPVSAAPYRRTFRAPVHFDAPTSELHFDRRWLEQPLAEADEAALMALRRAAQAAEAADPPHLDERVRAATRVLLTVGDLSAAHVAEALGLHERTLRRRLARTGLRLQDIVAEERFLVARQLLRHTGLTVQDIGLALGYAEDSTFVRAFRGWCGESPGQWRARQGATRSDLAQAGTGS